MQFWVVDDHAERLARMEAKTDAIVNDANASGAKRRKR